jgi:hypothetical protein
MNSREKGHRRAHDVPSSGVTLLLGVFAVGCGAPFSAAEEASDVATHDAGPLPDVVAHDEPESPAVPTDGDSEHDLQGSDGGTVLHDAMVDAPGNDSAKACTPPMYPLGLPDYTCARNYGPPITSPGSVWLVQSEATPTICWSVQVDGSAACEACADTYNCACLRPLLNGPTWSLGTSGQGCVDSDAGPYWLQ